MRAFAIIIAAVTLGGVGCDDDHPNATDAGVIDDGAKPMPGCGWPGTGGVPRGSAILGTDRDGFVQMGDELQLEYGTQDGYNLVAHARMSGFPPGDPHDFQNAGNPRTRISVYFDDTNVPLNYYARCPYRNGYVPSTAGDHEYELARAIPIVFETCWRSDNLFGRRLRIELEMVDANGNYAIDVKVITATAPDFYPDDKNSPGCVHELDTVLSPQ